MRGVAASLPLFSYQPPPSLRAAGEAIQKEKDCFVASAPRNDEHPVLESLAALDPDVLTPREALEALYKLKALAD